MRPLDYVLIALVILVTQIFGLTKTSDDSTEVVPRPLSSNSLRVSKTSSVASRSLDSQYNGENLTNDGGQKNDERLFSVPTAPESLYKLVESIEGAVFKTKKVVKNVAERLKSKNPVEEKKILDQEKVLPLQHDEIPAQNRRWNDAVSLSSAKDSILWWLKSTYRNVMRTKTERLINNINERMAIENLVLERKIVDQENFVRLLSEELGIQKDGWDYTAVVRSLTEIEQVGKESVPRVDPVDLMKSFHSLRGYPGMQRHADDLQSVLIRRFPDQVHKDLITLWEDSKLTIEEVFKMLPTALPFKIRGD